MHLLHIDHIINDKKNRRNFKKRLLKAYLLNDDLMKKNQF
jgi:hypothetical protein